MDDHNYYGISEVTYDMVYKAASLSTLQEVEKFVEGLPILFTKNITHLGGTLEQEKLISLQAILTHIQEMKGEL